MPRTSMQIGGYVRSVKLTAKYQEWEIVQHKNSPEFDNCTVRYPYTNATHPTPGNFVVVDGNWSNAWDYEVLGHAFKQYWSRGDAERAGFVE